MPIFYKFSILIFLFFAFMGGVFADKKVETKDVQTQTSHEEKVDIQKNINSYIMKLYKLQGNKILQDLDNNLSKVATTKEMKIEAYKNIQETLTLKKQQIKKEKDIGKNSRILLTKYLNYLIDGLEERTNKLQE